MRIVNVSNPACVGYEWSTDDGCYQVYQLRGTTGLYFGARGRDGRWYSTPVVNPERFTSVLHAARSIAGLDTEDAAS